MGRKSKQVKDVGRLLLALMLSLSMALGGVPAQAFAEALDWEEEDDAGLVLDDPAEPEDSLDLSVPQEDYDWEQDDAATGDNDALDTEDQPDELLEWDGAEEEVSALGEGDALVLPLAETVASGTWGTCNWELDSTGKLTVGAGTGADITGSSVPPWYEYRSQIKSVVFNSGVQLPAKLTGIFSGCSNLTTVNASAWNTSTVINMSHMFERCPKLATLDVSNWDTSSVVTMRNMFGDVLGGCSSLTSLDVSGWDVSNVTDMYSMFENCSALTSLDVSNWNTSGVTKMFAMFANCAALSSLDVSGWDVSSVADVRCMFGNCSALTSLDLSGWNLTSATSLNSLFSGCSSLETIEVPSWNAATANDVNDMDDIFRNCSSLQTIDLSGWQTAGAESMHGMFYGCTKLESIDLSGWDTSSVIYMYGMFRNCSSLKSLDMSGWDTSKVGSSSYENMFTGCSSLDEVKVGTGYTLAAFPPARYERGWWSLEDQRWYTVDEIVAGRLGIAGTYTAEETLVLTPGTDISGATVSSIPSQTYTGSAIRPSLTVTLGGKTLVADTDYTLSYQNNVNAGTATVTITGKGGYSGTKTAQFTILAKSLSSCTRTLSQSNYTYDGTEKTPTVTVKDGSTTLTAGTHYTITYSDNINAGTGTVTIRGKGNYSGIFMKTFTISAKSLSSCTMTLSQSSYTYDGTQKSPAVTVKDGSMTLEEGTDYTLETPSGRTDVGTYTYTATGKGNYTGTKTATLTISNPESKPMSSCTVTLSDMCYIYDGTQKTPTVTVEDGSTTLTEGTHYTVSYPNGRTNAGTYTVTVAGKGCYTGSVTRSFTIIPRIMSYCTVSLSQSSYTFDGTQKSPAVTVKDGSTTLTEGTHYTLTTPSGRTNAGTYTYTVTGKGNYSNIETATLTISAKSLSSCTMTLSQSSYTYDGTQKSPTVTVKDGSVTLQEGTDYTLETPSGRTDAGTYTYAATGKGNYTGTMYTCFTISNPESKPMSSCTVSLSQSSYTYDGTQKTPTVTVKDGSTTLTEGTHYTVSWPSGRTDAGTYTVTVVGKGYYTGSVTKTFAINPKSLSSCTMTLSQSSYIYDWETKSPTVTVKDGSTTLTAGTHYTLATPSGRKDAGTYTYTATGKGNYTGTKTATLTINPMPLSSCTVTLSQSSYAYDGTQKSPTVTVRDGLITLTEGTHYTLTTPSGRTNAGTYTYNVIGKGNYTGTKTVTLTISPKSMSSCTMTLSPSSCAYDGTQKSPTVTVKDGSTTLTAGTHYTLTTPSGRIDVGTYDYTVTGKGNYTGTKTATLTITAPQPLTRNDLRYSFSNGYDDFGYTKDSEIELASYKLVYGNAKAESLYTYNHNRGLKWKGSCYGMSTTSSMFNVDGSGFTITDFRSGASKVGDLRPTDASRGYVLRNYIEAMQVSHSDSVGSNQYYNSSRTLGVTAALNKLCDEVESSSEQGKPVVAEFLWCKGKDSGGDPVWGGHAVVAYAVERISSTQKRLCVYDPNFPNTDRSIILTTDSLGSCTGWYYKMNDVIDCGSSYSYFGSTCWISHVPYDAFKSFWLEGPSMRNRNTLILNAADFVIENASGHVVGEVEDGILGNAESNIIQVFNCDEYSESTSTTLLMPSDASYTLKASTGQGGEPLQALMLNEEQAASVTTDASEITLTVSDSEEVNFVDVLAGDGETYQVTLNSDLDSASGQESIELSGTGTGEHLSVGTMAGSCIVVNGDTATMTVNGAAVDIGSRLGIESGDASLEYEVCDYDGKAHEPKVTVTHDGAELVEDRDFVVKYASNVEPGTARATAYGIGGYDGRVELTFRIKPKQTVTASDKSVAMGKTVSLGARTSGDGTLSYKSSNTAVAKVSSSGVVTPVKVGTAKVTITAAATDSYAKATKTVTVTVTRGAQSVTASNKSVAVGKTVSLGAKASAGGTLSYKSSNTAVAKVSSAGVVTPVKPGKATITITAAATASYNSATKKVTVTVTKGTQAISASNKTVPVKGTVSLGAKRTAGDGKLTYKSSNEAVAKVSPTGAVTGVKRGQATITITAAATGRYDKATKKVTVTVKLANTLAAARKKATVTASLATLKTKSVTLASNVTVSKAQGAVSYANASSGATAKTFKVDATTGKLTVPKGTKKGTYAVKVKVTAKGTSGYCSGSKAVTYSVVVK